MAEFPTNISEYFSLGGSRTAQNAFESQNISIFSIISVIIKNLYVLTGIVLLFFLVAGGVGMIINAGNAEKQKQSSQTLTSAVVGYVIMFAAYWLVKIVEIVFGVEIFLL